MKAHDDVIGLIVTLVYFLTMPPLVWGLFQLGLPLWNGQPILAIVIAMPLQVVAPVIALLILGGLNET